MSLPKVTDIKALPGHRLRLRFRGLAKAREVDLTGLIARHALMRPLAGEALFRKARIIDGGAAVGWTEALDLGAATLLRMAQEQAPFGTKDFISWQVRLGLSNRETADALGVSLATIKNIRAGGPISNAIAIACRAMESDQAVIAAHFRPRKAGRPAKAA